MDEEPTEPVERHLTFIEAVLVRPAMYTYKGTFLEVVAFLDGFYSGWGRHRTLSSDDAENAESREWFAFFDWLTKRLNVNVLDVLDHVAGNNDAEKRHGYTLITENS